MGDRHGQPALPARLSEPLTAAARILRPIREDAPQVQSWQAEGWELRDMVGELRFAEMWLSNAFSRSRLFAARRPEPGQEPEPVEAGPAHDLVARLAGGVGGQSNILRAFGSYLMIPGGSYLVGEPRKGGDRFMVVDAEDIRLGTDIEGAPAYEVRTGDTMSDWQKMPPGTLATKVFRPHPRRRWEADSPTRAALPVLRELVLLTQHVEATATSRLAGAGLQAFPSEMQLPGKWEDFIEEWTKAMSQPIKNRGLASAVVPFPVRIPAAHIKALKDGYISYATTFDQKSIELREEAITRLGNAMDMPRQVLTGENRNHWGDWQVEESGLKLHVEPGLEIVCDGLTVGYLTPGLDASMDTSRAARLDLERVERETPLGEWIMWYDTSDLRVRPDRSGAISDAYDRFEAGGDDLRKELGITEAQAADPTDPDTQRRVWFSLITHETLGPTALAKLGLLSDDEVTALEPAPQPAQLALPAPADDGDRALPDTREDEPNPSDAPAPPVPAAAATLEVPDHVPGLTPAIALVAACDALVHRALERAGRRVLNKMPRRNGALPRQIGAADCPAVRLHTCVDLARFLPVDRLFEDAWERLPEVAERLGEDAVSLEATLDAYARVLVRTQVEHSWDSLARALGVCPCEAQVAEA